MAVDDQWSHTGTGMSAGLGLGFLLLMAIAWLHPVCTLL